ncbi:putative drought induced 19 type, zinc-binding protein [Lupinus albus]|uniref:Putative drought induced 19 type, zinc-binding protein n=1 Tax=Lupinus albus TaxID=3870 RepID=A0A6A4P3W3_LUPAL|nr:putative drought induced 19 type, zinc-binding protein [Lupinus albus]
MDSDSWISARLSNSSRRYHSRSDLYLGGHDDLDGGDDHRTEFLCPFCAEDYDVVGLCFHIDEDHPLEAKNGVCPVCGKKAGMDLVGHITMQHGNFLKISFLQICLFDFVILAVSISFKVRFFWGENYYLWIKVSLYSSYLIILS